MNVKKIQFVENDGQIEIKISVEMYHTQNNINRNIEFKGKRIDKIDFWL